MTKRDELTTYRTTNLNRSARIAGGLYLLLGVFGAFSMLYVPSALFVPGDAAATIRNIMAAEGLFHLGIVGALVTQVVQIIVALYLYRVLKPVSKNGAVLMVIFVLLAVPIAMLNELTHAAIPLLLHGGDHLSAFTTAQMHAMVPLLLELHDYGIMIAQIFWGLWLLPMGYLVYRSGCLPRIIGILLMIGCFGYLIDVAIFFFAPTVRVTVSEFTFIGELLLPLWLLVKGVGNRGRAPHAPALGANA